MSCKNKQVLNCSEGESAGFVVAERDYLFSVASSASHPHWYFQTRMYESDCVC